MSLFSELESNWFIVADKVELFGEAGTWSVYNHEVGDLMFLCIANDQHGSIKLLSLLQGVESISNEVCSEIREYRGLKPCDAITNFDLFMAKTGNNAFVVGATAFIIG